MTSKQKAQNLIKEFLKKFSLNDKGEKDFRLRSWSGEIPKTDIMYAYHLALALGFSGTDEPSQQQINVDVNIPQSFIYEENLNEIMQSLELFLDASGFDLKSEEEPVFGSFFQRLFFWTKKPRTQQELQEVYIKGKASLEANYLGKPVAEATSQLSIAAAQLIAACQGVDEIVLRAGALILVKTKVGDRTVMSIETVAPLLMNYLDENPGMLRDPRLVYEFLEQLPPTLKQARSPALSNNG